MTEFNYINIGEVGRFNPDDYPKMVAELDVMIRDLHPFPVNFRQGIVISYLKDTPQKTEWIDGNPGLVKLMTSRALVTVHTEKLFEACRWNKAFRADLERYIRAKLN